MPLTDTAIRKAKPRDKPRKLYDSRGLYLEIAPRGTKAWRFKYRFADKEKRISMGIYPEVSLKLARERRDDARKLLARNLPVTEAPLHIQERVLHLCPHRSLVPLAQPPRPALPHWRNSSPATAAESELERGR